MTSMSVSVIIPVHKVTRFLEQAVRSAVRDGADEVIVVAHGPTRGLTVPYLSNVRLISCPFTRPGPGEPKNAGLKRANGAYVTFLDADDLLVQGAIYARKEALDASPFAPAVFGRIDGLIDAEGKSLKDEKFDAWLHECDERNRSRTSLTKANLLANELPGYATLMYRRSFLHAAGPFDTSLPCAEDFDMACRIADLGLITFVDAPVIKYRVHGENSSIEMGPNGIVARPITRTAHAAAVKKVMSAKP